MMKNIVFGLGILAVLLVGSYWFIKKDADKPKKRLPKYGEIESVSEKVVDGKTVSDTLFHTVPDFKFVNQNGDTVSQKNLNGSVYVADFFFTTCPSICKDMAKQKIRLYQAFKNNPQVKILSHTVNPEFDSPSVLNAYAKRCKADDANKWIFVTGDKKQLYDIARTGYLVSATVGKGDADDFIHTEKFALVDKNKIIRGYYDGTNPLEVNQLMYDIEQLLLEK